MNVQVFKSAEQMGKAAAAMFAAQVIKKPESVLGLATGSTPLPVYANLIEMHKDGLLDFSKVISFNLDEYCGLAQTHDQSYYYFMRENLFKHINIRKEAIHVPSGTADAEAESAAYEKAICAAGGIDLQILGLGLNGHIGFNEPADDFAKVTHKVRLTESTIEANKRFFASADEVPREAITMGVGTIMAAREIIIAATGAGKAEAVAKLVKGEVTPQFPASVLQMHGCVTVMLDEAAAGLL